MDDPSVATRERPYWLVPLAVTVGLTLAMVYLRVVLYPHRIVPLSYALPLLIGLWHRNRILLWGMAVCFMVVSASKLILFTPDSYFTGQLEQYLFTSMQWLNILVTAFVIHLVVRYREQLERSHDALESTNSELETTNEELTAREEEITRQNEELQSQTEELEQQAEELRVQTEELETLNSQLRDRESTLHTLLELSSTSATEEDLWRETCAMASKLLGDDAPVAMVLERCSESFLLRAHQGVSGDGQLDRTLAARGSLADLVMQRCETGQIEDIKLRPDLQLPQPNGGPAYRAALSAPIRFRDAAVGVVEVYATQPRSWESDKARLLDWLSKQCSVVLEAIRLREELRRIHERLAWVLDKTGVGMWLNELPLGRLNWDRRTRELLFVLPDEEPTIELFWQRLHPDDRQRTRLAVEAAVQDHTTYAIDHRVVNPETGEIRWIHSAGRATYNSDGTPARFDGVNYDITAQKEAAKALADSEQRLALAASAGRVGIFDWDVPHGQLQWTSEQEAIFGYQPTSGTTTIYRYQDWTRRIHPDDLPEVERQLQRSLTQLSAYEGEYRLAWPDGSVRWVAMRGEPQCDESQQGVRMLGTVIDITERKRAQEQLAATYQRLQTLMEAVPVGVSFSQDAACRRIIGNPAAYAQFEAKMGDNLLAAMSDAAQRDRRTRFFQQGQEIGVAQFPLQRAVAENRVIAPVELEVVLPSGRRWCAEASGAPLRDDAGNVIGGLAVTVDITHRKAAELELRESERRFRTLAESIPQLAWMAEPDGHIFWYNQRWYDYTGTTWEEMKERGWESLHDPAKLPRVVKKWEAALATGTPWEDTFPLRRRDGAMRWHLSRAMPLRGESGEIIRWFGTNTDITERREVEIALRESREQFRIMGESIPYGVWLCDPRGDVKYVSQSFLDLLEMTLDEARSFGWTRRLPPEDVEPTLKRWRQCLTTGADWDDEYRVLGPDGTYHTILTRGKPVRDEQGHVVSWVGINLDISNRKRLEEELRQAKDVAETANLAKSRFVANISHELRTPMNAILGMLDLVLQRVNDTTSMDCLETARDSADLLLALLNDLLDSAKLEAGKLELESAPFSLRRVIEQTSRALAVRASEKGLVFSCRVPPDMPDAVVGDVVRLRQVLFNLIGNAIKFTEAGEIQLTVQVESRAEEEVRLRFAVRDTGIGIARGELSRLFEPFSQGDGSTTRRFGGTGLGLSICTNLVGMMGGRIEVESEPGNGSTFHFIIALPLAKELPAPAEERFPLPEAPPASLRILLAEDNRGNQKLASYILQDRGHVVEIAGDGRQALQLVRENRYDAVLMDVQMPGMDGFAATAAIRALQDDRARVPIIAMTAHAAEDDRRRCLQHGMDEYLCKPIVARELISMVEAMAAGMRVSRASSAWKTSEEESSQAIFDPEEGLRRCYDRQEMFEAMVDCFFADVENLLPQLRETLQKGDLVELGRLGHRFKGTVVYLGANRARDAAIQVERFTHQGGDSADAEEAVQALEREIKALSLALGLYRAAGKEG